MLAVLALAGGDAHFCGPNFGAAAAAGALAGVDERQARHLLSYAAQQASGISCWMRDKDHIEKSFDCGGMAARNGVTAAMLVASGLTGVDDVFSGERNFYVAFGNEPDRDILVSELGARFEILNAAIKQWTVGSPIQAPLEALQTLLARQDIPSAPTLSAFPCASPTRWCPPWTTAKCRKSACSI